MDGLEMICQRMTQIQEDLKVVWDKDVRRDLWLEFEALYFEFLENL